MPPAETSEATERKRRVSDILDTHTDLIAAGENAFRSNKFLRGQYSSEDIVEALRIRYLNRLLRAVKHRPCPDAPVTYMDAEERPRVIPLEKLRPFVLRTWKETADRLACRHTWDVRPVLRDVDWKIRVIIGVCVIAHHPMFARPLTQPSIEPNRTYFAALPDEDAREYVRRFILGVRAADWESIRPLLGACSRHQTAVCRLCETATIRVTDADELLPFLSHGCPPCRNREWLALQTPPKYNAHALRAWLSNTQQSIEVL